MTMDAEISPAIQACVQRGLEWLRDPEWLAIKAHALGLCAMIGAMNTEILYIQPETLLRLLAQERLMRREDGVAFFRQDDHAFPDVPVMVATEVTGNAVHRRVWSPFDRRHIFEFVGDV